MYFQYKCVKYAYAKKVLQKVFETDVLIIRRNWTWFYSFSDSFLLLNFYWFFLGFVPVCSVGVSQVAKLNLGKSVGTLKYFTICGLQEGYEPFAVNMNRDVTMWISKRLPQFVPIPTNHQHIQVEPGQQTCTFWRRATISIFSIVSFLFSFFRSLE